MNYRKGSVTRVASCGDPPAAGAALTAVVRGWRFARSQWLDQGELSRRGGTGAFGSAAVAAYRDNRGLVERMVRDVVAAGAFVSPLRHDSPLQMVSVQSDASRPGESC